MSSLFSLSNQVALVTGSTGHLGQAMAITLAKAGARVYLNGRNAEKVEQLALKLKQQDLDVVPAVFDITDQEQVASFFEQADLKKINVLVNNAYAGKGGTVTTALDEDYLTSFDVTLVAAQRLLKHCLPLMEAGVLEDNNAGCINISSMYGVVSPEQSIYGSPKEVNPPFYGAAKAALIQWTKYAASELAAKGVRVNCISPGAFPSEQAQTNVELMAKLQRKVPLERFGQPDELQGPVLFLASRASSYVTGHNLIVDGGWTVR